MESKYTPKTSEPPIYILTNNIGVEGAVSVLYTDILENLKTKLQDNLYVIPSSINEVLIVPKKFADVDSAKNMVKNINHNMVAENICICMMEDKCYLKCRPLLLLFA